VYRDLTRDLRKNLTDAERRLWSRLRGQQFREFKFRRQAPIGPSIVNFAYFERKVIVELDGSQHAVRVEKDEARTRWLVSQGFRVLRFWNHEVFEDLDTILEGIWLALAPHPDPPPRGRDAKRSIGGSERPLTKGKRAAGRSEGPPTPTLPHEGGGPLGCSDQGIVDESRFPGNVRAHSAAVRTSTRVRGSASARGTRAGQ
jgi:very-short-patch-repair endonuclease